MACPNSQAAFGRCSTSQRRTNGGDCPDDVSHSTQCCDSSSTISDNSCGWIYVQSGMKQKCPSGYLISGFCGVNDKARCPNESYLGIRCCSPNK